MGQVNHSYSKAGEKPRLEPSRTNMKPCRSMSDIWGFDYIIWALKRLEAALPGLLQASRVASLMGFIWCLCIFLVNVLYFWHLQYPEHLEHNLGSTLIALHSSFSSPMKTVQPCYLLPDFSLKLTVNIHDPEALEFAGLKNQFHVDNTKFCCQDTAWPHL